MPVTADGNGDGMPAAGAPVSVPLTWDELTHADPADHTVWSVPALLADRPCPWAAMDGEAGDVSGALALWAAQIALNT